MSRPDDVGRRTSEARATRARRLRREMTVPERVLWYLLRDRRLARLKFRRQHPIGRYFVDFYCAAFQLVIEVDGRSHDDRGEYDARRQHDLERRGLKVLRVSNDEILDDPESIILGILGVVETDREGSRVRPEKQQRSLER
ncbi:endonuclease domain-containing protein [Tautonia sp. JC769]|uniref:endonuclease domain-containing protein n=1 Tax=Tautonia sp. JC769 TaxID=3232135 RepID=UPI0034595859